MDFLSVPIDKILDASTEMTHSVTVVAAEPACQVHAALLRAPVTRAPVRELGDRALSGKRFSTGSPIRRVRLVRGEGRGVSD
jgi:hypothetical protein